MSNNYGKSLSGPNVHDPSPPGSKAHRFDAKGCVLSANRGPKIPRAPVHYVATIVYNQELSPLSPDGPSTVSLRPDRIHQLLVTPWATAERKTKITKPPIACGARLSWCPRPDSNRRRPGLGGPYSGVSGVFPMRCNPYISAIPGFRSIYAVASKTPVPWLRGDAVVTDSIPLTPNATTCVLVGPPQ